MQNLSRRAAIGGAIGLSTLASAPRGLAAPAGAMVGLNVEGTGAARAYAATPEQAQAHGVVLIHEWWGLNDQIKRVVDEYAQLGFFALGVDLFGGQVAASAAQARTLTGSVDPKQAVATLSGWVNWLRDHPRGSGKVAVIGWCFGGGWSLRASLHAPVDATVIYYGRVNVEASQLGTLRSPVLGHFATRDQFINRKMVAGFEKTMQKTNKRLTTHWYEADHGFANPTSARYDSEEALLARRRTLDFLREVLG